MYLTSYHKKHLILKYKRRKHEKQYSNLIKRNKDARILVIFHYFYPECWDEVKEYLVNLRCYRWELLITYPKDRKEQLNLAKIRKFKHDTKFLPCTNVGFDVAPFIKALDKINLNNYDVVFKLQSKGVKRRPIYLYRQLLFGRYWFASLFEGSIGARYVHTNIDSIKNNDEWDFAAASNLVVRDLNYRQSVVIDCLKKYGLDSEMDYQFIAGTCFVAKPAALKKLQHLGYTDEDFEIVPFSRGTTLAHGIERYITTQTGRSTSGGILENDVCRFTKAVKKPIENILEKFSVERLDKESFTIDPYYFNWRLDYKLVKYKLNTIPVGKLRLHYRGDTKPSGITELKPYKYLEGDVESYLEYCKFVEENKFTYTSKENFDNLIQSMRQNEYQMEHVIVVNGQGLIQDGQHKACIIAYDKGLDYKVQVLHVRVFNIKSFLKLFIPLLPNPILKKLYNKETIEKIFPAEPKLK